MNIQNNKYLTFSLGQEEYGIPILMVKEIIGMMVITEMPRTPDFIRGVINLRGKIIPIMDLRLKFGLEEKTYNERTCIIVVEINKNDEIRPMGIAVDAVTEVVSIQKEAIEPPPHYNDDPGDSFLIGMGKVKEKVIMLLNIGKIVNEDEMVLLDKIKGE